MRAGRGRPNDTGSDGPPDSDSGKTCRAYWDLIVALRRLLSQVVNVGTPKAALLGMLAAFVLRVPVRIYLVRGLRLETVPGPLRWYWR